MKHILLILLLMTIKSFSQIEVEKRIKQNPKKIIAKLDSTVNIDSYKTAEQYLSLIGSEIYSLPKNLEYQFSHKNLTIPDNSYFIIDSVKFLSFKTYENKKGLLIQPSQYDQLVKNKYTRESVPAVKIFSHQKDTRLKFIFLNNKESAYDKGIDFNQLILLPYYYYNKKKFEGKNILYTPSNFYKYEKDIYGNLKSEIDSSDIYKVLKLSVKETNTKYNPYFKLMFTLQNSKKELLEEDFRTINNHSIFLSDYSKLIESIRLKKHTDSLLLVQNKAHRKILMIKKYGKYNGKIISENKVRIGMNKKMCIDAWGKPDDINKTTGSFGVHEQWVYDSGSYLYFENGKLTSIQN